TRILCQNEHKSDVFFLIWPIKGILGAPFYQFHIMKKLLLSMFFLLLTPMLGFAQNRTSTGTVTGQDDGQPLPGVSVRVRGVNTGTLTNSDGKSSISVPSASSVLEFSYIGYATKSATASSTVVNVVLAGDAQS